MTTRKIERKDWKAFFDGISKAGGLEGKRADIEVAGLNLGDQIAAKWVPLFGVGYNPKDDTIEVALESLGHMIRRPAEIFVEESGAALVSVSVTDGEGLQHIIRLSDPLMLGAGSKF